MLTCPDRAAGRCPYTRELVGGGRGACLPVTVALLALAAGVLWWAVGQTDFSAQVLGLILALGLAAAGIVGVLYLRSGPAVMLVNRETGASWSQITLGRWTFSEQVTLPTEPLDLDLHAGYAPRYPPSAAALCVMAASRIDDLYRATDVVEHTLIALIALDLLRVQVGRRLVSFWGRPLHYDSSKYLLVPGPRTGQTTLSGALELRLLRVVTEAHFQDLDDRATVKLLTTAWHFPPKTGIEVQSLLERLYEHDEPDPAGWLLDLVRVDVSGRDLCLHERGEGLIQPRVAPQHLDRMRVEAGEIQVLWDALAQAHPDFMRTLRRQITDGILARQKR
jgi:hypothetical protein